MESRWAAGDATTTRPSNLHSSAAPPRPLTHPPAPFGSTPFLGSIPGISRHGPPPARQRIPIENPVFLREQLGPSDRLFRCPVFERLCKEQRLVHRCQSVRLDDLLAVLKHLVNEHMDACCPICYRELLEVKNLEVSHFKKGPAFFEKIQYAIAHIRWNHTKPWYYRVCNLRFGAKTNYNVHMREHPDHETRERKSIAGYYDEKMQSSDEKLGRCSNKEALDDWELDRPVESRRYSVWPNDGVFPARTGPREDRVFPPPAAPTMGLHSQPSQAGGYAGSHWSLQHPPTYTYQHVAHNNHQPNGSAQSTAIYSSGSTPAGESIQDLAGRLGCDPAQGRRRRRHPHASPNDGEFQLQPGARQVDGYAGSHGPVQHPRCLCTSICLLPATDATASRGSPQFIRMSVWLPKNRFRATHGQRKLSSVCFLPLDRLFDRLVNVVTRPTCSGSIGPRRPIT